MENKRDEFSKDKIISILEGECEMLYDQLVLDKNYVADTYSENCKNELLEYYFEPKKFLSTKF